MVTLLLKLRIPMVGQGPSLAGFPPTYKADVPEIEVKYKTNQQIKIRKVHCAHIETT